MENTSPTEKKQSVIKSLAVAGLLGLTVLIAWLAIQIVQLFPSALTSLVGVADSVYNYNPLATREITLKEHTTLVNAGEAFTLSWETPLVNGTYTFSYECEPGASVSLSNDTVDFSNLDCATEYDIGNTDAVTLFINTTTERFTTITYTLAFYRPNSQTPSAEQSAEVTIVNQTITEISPVPESPATEEIQGEAPAPTEVEPTPAEPQTPTEPTVTEPIATTTDAKPVSKPETTSTEASAPSSPTYTYTYSIPVSNPNGTADLSVSILGVGVVNNDRFTRTDRIYRGLPGALQFSVHNLGDKTSTEWRYEVRLPDGTLYQSRTERPLLPNERSVFTLSYPAVLDIATTATILVTVYSEGPERTTTNNLAGRTESITN
jgi:hypothetical protein